MPFHLKGLLDRRGIPLLRKLSGRDDALERCGSRQKCLPVEGQIASRNIRRGGPGKNAQHPAHSQRSPRDLWSLRDGLRVVACGLQYPVLEPGWQFLRAGPAEKRFDFFVVYFSSSRRMASRNLSNAWRFLLTAVSAGMPRMPAICRNALCSHVLKCTTMRCEWDLSILRELFHHGLWSRASSGHSHGNTGR